MLVAYSALGLSIELCELTLSLFEPEPVRLDLGAGLNKVESGTHPAQKASFSRTQPLGCRPQKLPCRLVAVFVYVTAHFRALGTAAAMSARCRVSTSSLLINWHCLTSKVGYACSRLLPLVADVGLTGIYLTSHHSGVALLSQVCIGTLTCNLVEGRHFIAIFFLRVGLGPFLWGLGLGPFLWGLAFLAAIPIASFIATRAVA
mmetsp:Transcript_27690/g.77428  ORF Transcript_27690/g.77428 Transcript_27690/m.77428 type:complete len:203 (-) Transcript_27690:2128-2736(-)|eukprot:scaffold133291_cov31-Tisochrysis_lutea.AAC.2